MALNVDIKKKEGKNTSLMLKEFTKLVRSSGVVNKVKSSRYFERKASFFKKKKEALRRIQKTQERERLQKLGKIK